MAEAKVKLAYSGAKEHVFNCPGTDKSAGFKVVLDEKGKASVTAEQWEALEAHAANGGIVRV